MFKLSDEEKERIEEFLKPYLSDEEVLKMKEYVQHGSVSTYEHAFRVAECCYYISRRLHIRCNEEDLMAAAFLHDFYLYDWHDADPSHKFHGFTHAEAASINAARHFHISDNAENAIRSHMWPLNITKVPRSREALILTVSDKLCSAKETIFNR